MKRALKQYQENAILFKKVRLDNGYSMREVSLEIGVGHCTIQRFEHMKAISAMHYIALMWWLNHNRRCY